MKFSNLYIIAFKYFQDVSGKTSIKIKTLNYTGMTGLYAKTNF